MKKAAVFIMSVVIVCVAGCQQQGKDVAKITGQPDVRFSVVAQFLQKDGGQYLTRQQYEIYSDQRAMVLTSDEPYGKVVWSVQNGEYAMQKNQANRAFDKNLYNLMTNKNIAHGLLEIYLAGLGKIQPTAEKESLNFDGQTYELAAQAESDIKIYQNKSTGMLNLVKSGENNSGIYILRGYNYLKFDGQDSFYASKVDIYLCHADDDKELVGQVNCSLK